jgi:hypothetical protein
MEGSPDTTFVVRQLPVSWPDYVTIKKQYVLPVFLAPIQAFLSNRARLAWSGRVVGNSRFHKSAARAGHFPGVI